MAFGGLKVALLLVKRSSSPRSFLHETTCPPHRLTRAEAPLGERSTTWATPFQSLITSSPDVGSMELTKRPMLIDGQASSKQRALDSRPSQRTAAREAERARDAGEEEERRTSVRGSGGGGRCGPAAAATNA